MKRGAFPGSRIFDCAGAPGAWAEFPAEGFRRACGVRFRPGGVSSGVPLGGIGTGAVDWNPDGTLGRTTMFNSFTPPRGQDLPVFFLETAERAFVLGSKPVDGWENPRDSRYWGHYPFADAEHDMPGTIQAGVRAWAPFVPGDAILSNTPAIEFDVRIRNLGRHSQKVALVVQLPGPTLEEAETKSFRRKVSADVCRIGDPSGVHHAVMIAGGVRRQTGGTLCGDFRPGQVLPKAGAGDSGFSARIGAEVEAGAETRIRITWGWFAPVWKPSFYREYRQFYTRRFDGAVAAAGFLTNHHAEIQERALAAQRGVFAQTRWPVWLRDQMVNIQHTLAKDGFWAAERVPPDSWYGEYGIFGLSESPRSVPHVAIPSDFYGSLPLALHFPDLLRQMLRAYAHFQLKNGEIPLGLGWGSDLGSPIYGFLHTTNAATFIDLAHRLHLASPGSADEFIPAVKSAIGYLLSLDRDSDGLPDLDPWPTGNQFYGAWHWLGTATHTNGFFLTALSIGASMTRTADPAFSAQCRRAFKKAAGQLEKKLWGGKSYLLYHDTKTGAKSDTVLANQLVGHLLARVHNLPSPFPPDRVRTALATIRRLHLGKSKYGLRNALRPDGGIDRSGPRHSTHMFPGEAILVAATLAYEGHRKQALDLAENVMHNLVIRQGRAWDPPNEIDPVTGRPTYGTDFYQMMVLWFLPLALDGIPLGPAATWMEAHDDR